MATKNKTITLPAEQAAAIETILALLASGEAPAKVVEQAKVVTPDRPAHEVAMEERGVRPAKGSTVLTPEGIKAAARVLKSGKPEVVPSPEGNGDHVVLFTTDKGNIRVQNAYTPKAS